MGLWDPEWLHGALNVIIGVFRRYEQVANISKSKAMTCQLVSIWYGMLEEAVA